jgi:hypothetical protein
VVTKEEAQQLCDELDLICCFETSALDNTNVDEAFFMCACAAMQGAQWNVDNRQSVQLDERRAASDKELDNALLYKDERITKK